jgi:HAD superfamily hydrolase (TIGR01509 family)
MHPKPFRGVILDVDGTLVDSNDAHAKAWCEVFERHGYHPSYALVRLLIGMGGDKLIPEVTGLNAESAKAKAMSRERSRLFRESYLPRIRAFPSTRELVRRIQAEGLRVVVGSSAKREELEPLLELADVADLVGEKTSKDDAKHSKPDPDIVRASLAKLALPPEAVLMIGDTPYDIEAAGRAGVRTLALRCGGWDDEGLSGALAIYADPQDLLSHFEDSALAVRAGRAA